MTIPVAGPGGPGREPAGSAAPPSPAGGPGRTGVVLRDALPWADCLEVVRTAEDTGYEAVFVPEIAGREAFATLAGFAGATARLRLGTGVVTVGARSPTTTAMAAATVQELSGGRMVLGIGAGSVGVRPAGERAGPASPGSAGPVRAVRDYVRVVRDVLAGRTVEGSGFRLEPTLTRPPPPIWIGALGDRMIRLAGEVADGVILNWCTPERVRAARALAEQGARGAGRDPARFTVAVYVRACLGVEEDVALRALAAMTGQYASYPQYLRQFELMGLGEEARLAAKAFRERRLSEVPEPLVRALTVAGGRDEALARFERYRRAGADLVLCYPVAALDPFSSVLGTVLAAAPSPAVER
jgi:alkanesulfonate monooxygenase SsuD/methylene tetrahydromethanopterin reductase-like flavin-dependent oxidoreductase (luciferase family)